MKDTALLMLALWLMLSPPPRRKARPRLARAPLRQVQTPRLRLRRSYPLLRARGVGDAWRSPWQDVPYGFDMGTSR